MALRLPCTEGSIKPEYLEYVTDAVECMCPEHIDNEQTLGNSKLAAVTQRYGEQGSMCDTQLYLCVESHEPDEMSIMPTFTAGEIATLRSHLNTLNSIVQPVVAEHVRPHRFQTNVTDNDCDYEIRDARDKTICAARLQGIRHPYGGLSHWTRHEGAASDTVLNRGEYRYVRIDLVGGLSPAESDFVLAPLSHEETRKRILGWVQAPEGIEEG